MSNCASTKPSKNEVVSFTHDFFHISIIIILVSLNPFNITFKQYFMKAKPYLQNVYFLLFDFS